MSWGSPLGLRIAFDGHQQLVLSQEASRVVDHDESDQGVAAHLHVPPTVLSKLSTTSSALLVKLVSLALLVMRSVASPQFPCLDTCRPKALLVTLPTISGPIAP